MKKIQRLPSPQSTNTYEAVRVCFCGKDSGRLIRRFFLIQARPVLGRISEFCCKVRTSVVNGYSFMEHMSFDSLDEGIFLRMAVERYKERFRCYPEAVMADVIFRNRENYASLKAPTRTPNAK